MKVAKKRVVVKRIPNDRVRQVTFSKRKFGLMKKAYEMSVLCGVQLGIVIFSANNKLYEFASDDMDSVMIKYMGHERAFQSYTSADVEQMYNGTGADDNEDGDESPSAGPSTASVQNSNSTSHGAEGE